MTDAAELLRFLAYLGWCLAILCALLLLCLSGCAYLRECAVCPAVAGKLVPTCSVRPAVASKLVLESHEEIVEDMPSRLRLHIICPF